MTEESVKSDVRTVVAEIVGIRMAFAFFGYRLQPGLAREDYLKAASEVEDPAFLELFDSAEWTRITTAAIESVIEQLGLGGSVSKIDQSDTL